MGIERPLRMVWEYGGMGIERPLRMVWGYGGMRGHLGVCGERVGRE